MLSFSIHLPFIQSLQIAPSLGFSTGREASGRQGREASGRQGREDKARADARAGFENLPKSR